jgi:hypothetical protein
MFARCTGSPVWTAVWTLYWLIGSPMLPALERCGDGAMYFVNHALSQTGLLLLLGGVLSRPRPRVGVSLVGLVLASWSRHLTFLYVVALLWAVFRRFEPGRRWPRLVAIALVAALIVGLPLVLNTLKFGHPLDAGYGYIFKDMQTAADTKVQQWGLFNLHYLQKDAWHLFCAVPGLSGELLPTLRIEWEFSEHGNSILFTTPVLLFILFDVRRWWKDGLSRWLMVPTAGVLVAILTYQNTGYYQPGFHRFALDFLLPWMVVIAGRTATPRRTWLIAVMLAWSVAYFQMV